MRSKLLLCGLLPFAAASAQSVSNGQFTAPCAPTMNLDTAYISGYLDLSCNIASYTVKPGAYGGQVFHLTVKNEGGFTISGQPGNLMGDTSIKPSGMTYFRLVWDVPSHQWVSTRIGLQAAKLMSVTLNPDGTVTYLMSDGTSIVSTGSLQGPAGQPGTNGKDGASGTPGTNGSAGSAATVGVGTVISGAAGSAPVVTNSGTSSAAVLNFTIPAGPTGQTGPSGTTSIGTCTASQTATTAAILAGIRTLTGITCNGVVSGGAYFLSQTAASVTANNVYALAPAAQGTALNTMQVQVNGPAIALGGTYTLTFNVWRMN